MTQGPVTLFSNRQFSGSSVPLDEGDTRFSDDFNDSVSSVRVATGYCAVLHEHGNEFGGYGALVDLLEDCPDLSVYGFDKKTSYVSVFRTERDGFVYARGAMRDGQFVPGHWERKRASGGSDLNSTTAVVAPAAPPRTQPLSAGAGPVTLFSGTLFSGFFVPSDEGGTRFSAEFNDSASSIRVAPGYCAVLHEHANEFGGYGASVDLLEDCPDLSVYGFDKKTSYLHVFRTERDGFVWARAAMRDGQFVSGHWQRKRARGGSNINGTTAVVAPPAPPRTAPPPAGGGAVIVRDHRGEPQRLPPRPSTGDPIVRDHRASKIKHVFVLMLENRSFDHMLGFSGITGTDAATGQPTVIDGLNGSESNSFNGAVFPVVRGAPDRAPYDPPHGFPGVVEQLCGEGAVYASGQPYPPINCSGYVSVYAKSHPELPDGAMRCFTPDQVPVMTALAREFVVCDRWFSSMPGPTEPNRWFVHAGTAGFFDEGPTHAEYAQAFSSPWSGIAFSQGTIFDRLRDAGVKYRIYACDSFPNVAMLKGVSRTFDVDDFDEDFASDVASPSYDAAYTFIEPSYDAFSEYEDGNSHHPLGSVRAGELLIKQTYEALRRSPIWDSSMLIITYDEHGGFYDHVPPPAARPTGSTGRKFGFTFDRLGPRVPAIVVSPLIPRNLVDHRTYEHTSVVSTLIRLFGLENLTVRSSMTSDLKPLATLAVPRTDAPMTLPDPVGGTLARIARTPFENAVASRPARPLADDPTGMIAATVRSGLTQHLELTPPGEHEAIVARVNALQTHGDALAYLQEVDLLVKGARKVAGVGKSASIRVRDEARAARGQMLSMPGGIAWRLPQAGPMEAPDLTG